MLEIRIVIVFGGSGREIDWKGKFMGRWKYYLF